MAFKNEMKLFILVVFGISQIAATNIDCNGRAFHCVNTTHFMICVDLGGGISKTVDDFVIPCPPTTGCLAKNIFECEYLTVLTTVSTVPNSAVNNYNITESETTPDWEQIVLTTNELIINEDELSEKYFDINESTQTTEIVTLNANVESTAVESKLQTLEMSFDTIPDTNTQRNKIVTDSLETLTPSLVLNTPNTDLYVEKNTYITTPHISTDEPGYLTESSFTATKGTTFLSFGETTEHFETAVTEPQLVPQEGLTEKKYDEHFNTESELLTVPVTENFEIAVTEPQLVPQEGLTEKKYDEHFNTESELLTVPVTENFETAVTEPQMVPQEGLTEKKYNEHINTESELLTVPVTENFVTAVTDPQERATTPYWEQIGLTTNELIINEDELSEKYFDINKSTQTTDIVTLNANVESTALESKLQTPEMSFDTIPDTNTQRNEIVTDSLETLTPSHVLNTPNTDLYVEKNTYITTTHISTDEPGYLTESSFTATKGTTFLSFGETTENFETAVTEPQLVPQEGLTEKKYDEHFNTESELLTVPVTENFETAVTEPQLVPQEGLTEKKYDEHFNTESELLTVPVTENFVTAVTDPQERATTPYWEQIGLTTNELIINEEELSEKYFDINKSTQTTDIVTLNANVESTAVESNLQTPEMSFDTIPDTNTQRNEIVTDSLETLTPSHVLNTPNTDLYVEKNTYITTTHILTDEPGYLTESSFTATKGTTFLSFGETTENFETAVTEPQLVPQEGLTEKKYDEHFNTESELLTVPVTENFETAVTEPQLVPQEGLTEKKYNEHFNTESELLTVPVTKNFKTAVTEPQERATTPDWEQIGLTTNELIINEDELSDKYFDINKSTQTTDIVTLNANVESTVVESKLQTPEMRFDTIPDTNTQRNNIVTDSLETLTPSLVLNTPNTDLYVEKNAYITTPHISMDEPGYLTESSFTATKGTTFLSFGETTEHFETAVTEPQLVPQEGLTEKKYDEHFNTESELLTGPVTENFETAVTEPQLVLQEGLTEKKYDEHFNTESELLTVPVTENFETAVTEPQLFPQEGLTEKKYDEHINTESELLTVPVTENFVTAVTDPQERATTPYWEQIGLTTNELIINEDELSDKYFDINKSTQTTDIVTLNANVESTAVESKLQTPEMSFDTIPDTNTQRNEIVTDSLETLTPSLVLNTPNTDLYVEKNTYITTTHISTDEPGYLTESSFTATKGTTFLSFGETTENFETAVTEPQLVPQEGLTEKKYDEHFNTESELLTVPVTENFKTAVTEPQERATTPDWEQIGLTTNELIINEDELSDKYFDINKSTQTTDIVTLNANVESTVVESKLQTPEMRFDTIPDTNTQRNKIETNSLETLTPSLVLNTPNTDLHVEKNTYITTTHISTDEPGYLTESSFTATKGTTFLSFGETTENFETAVTEPQLVPQEGITEKIYDEHFNTESELLTVPVTENFKTAVTEPQLVPQKGLTEKKYDEHFNTESELLTVLVTEKVLTTEAISTYNFTETKDDYEIPTQVSLGVLTTDMNSTNIMKEIVLPSFTLKDKNADVGKVAVGDITKSSSVFEKESISLNLSTLYSGLEENPDVTETTLDELESVTEIYSQIATDKIHVAVSSPPLTMYSNKENIDNVITELATTPFITTEASFQSDDKGLTSNGKDSVSATAFISGDVSSDVITEEIVYKLTENKKPYSISPPLSADLSLATNSPNNGYPNENQLTSPIRTTLTDYNNTVATDVDLTTNTDRDLSLMPGHTNAITVAFDDSMVAEMVTEAYVEKQTLSTNSVTDFERKTSTGEKLTTIDTGLMVDMSPDHENNISSTNSLNNGAVVQTSSESILELIVAQDVSKLSYTTQPEYLTGALTTDDNNISSEIITSPTFGLTTNYALQDKLGNSTKQLLNITETIFKETKNELPIAESQKTDLEIGVNPNTNKDLIALSDTYITINNKPILQDNTSSNEVTSSFHIVEQNDTNPLKDLILNSTQLTENEKKTLLVSSDRSKPQPQFDENINDQSDQITTVKISKNANTTTLLDVTIIDPSRQQNSVNFESTSKKPNSTINTSETDFEISNLTPVEQTTVAISALTDDTSKLNENIIQNKLESQRYDSYTTEKTGAESFSTVSEIPFWDLMTGSSVGVEETQFTPDMQNLESEVRNIFNENAFTVSEQNKESDTPILTYQTLPTIFNSLQQETESTSSSWSTIFGTTSATYKLSGTGPENGIDLAISTLQHSSSVQEKKDVTIGFAGLSVSTAPTFEHTFSSLVQKDVEPLIGLSTEPTDFKTSALTHQSLGSIMEGTEFTTTPLTEPPVQITSSFAQKLYGSVQEVSEGTIASFDSNDSTSITLENATSDSKQSKDSKIEIAVMTMPISKRKPSSSAQERAYSITKPAAKPTAPLTIIRAPLGLVQADGIATSSALSDPKSLTSEQTSSNLVQEGTENAFSYSSLGVVEKITESTIPFSVPNDPVSTSTPSEDIIEPSTEITLAPTVQKAQKAVAQISGSVQEEAKSTVGSKGIQGLTTEPTQSYHIKTLTDKNAISTSVQERIDSANVSVGPSVSTTSTITLPSSGSVQEGAQSKIESPIVPTAPENVAYVSLGYVQEGVEGLNTEFNQPTDLKTFTFEHESSSPVEEEIGSTSVLSASPFVPATFTLSSVQDKSTRASSIASYIPETLSLDQETKESTMDSSSTPVESSSGLVEEKNSTNKKNATLTSPSTTLDVESSTVLNTEPGSTATTQIVGSSLVQREEESTTAIPLASTVSKFFAARTTEPMTDTPIIAHTFLGPYSKPELDIASEASTVPKTYSFETSLGLVQEPTESTTSSVVESTVNNVQFTCINRFRGRYADQEDCKRFYVCIGIAQPIAGICPVNTVFSELKKQCTKNLSHCLRQRNFQCVKEGRFSDIYSNNIYYICVQGELGKFYRFKFQCQNGYYLNKISMKCVENKITLKNLRIYEDSTSKSESDKSISVSSNKSKESEMKKGKKEKFECKKEGKFPHPEDCRKYYECSKNKSEYRRKLKQCDSDELFHKKRKKCVDADSYEC